jgi:tetraacyldisaccharide 4'-kinase
MSARAALEAWAHRQWASRGLVPCLLTPLAFVYLCIVESRRRSVRPKSLPVPVLVVGNIYVGGTGKTPITIALVKELIARGWHPGIVSRGFGRRGDGVKLVEEESLAADVGDEPLLIRRSAGVPVAVGAEREKAGELLLKSHPETDLIVSDDGLQHLELARDLELAVVGAGGIGNGWVLPAGPLREPPSRLDTVDAIVLNTTDEAVIESRTPRFATSSCFGPCRRLKDGEQTTIDALSEKIAREKLRPLAAAGIASPGRFFAMVRAHGIDCAELELGDHFGYERNPFAERGEDIIFITGKDAVKCAQHAEIASDPRIWVVDLEIKLDAYLVDFVDERLKAAAKAKKAAEGKPAA